MEGKSSIGRPDLRQFRFGLNQPSEIPTWRSQHDLPYLRSPRDQRHKFDEAGETQKRVSGRRNEVGQDLQDHASRAPDVDEKERTPERTQALCVDASENGGDSR